MKKRILAILALVFFALGVGVFFYCIAAKRTDLSLYAVIFCAPGAALALAFPAPAVSGHQALLNASYVVTHALILVIPSLGMARGMRPQRGRSLAMMGALLVIAAVAGAVNRRLGTDFLFLAAPPAGTPLEAVFDAGYPAYLGFLFVMMLSLCLIMDALAGGRKRRK